MRLIEGNRFTLGEPDGSRSPRIEALSQASGRPLPQGYYERIRRDPHFFEHRRHWPSWRPAPQLAPGGEPLTLRIDTPIEVDYYLHGGVLPFVLRQLLAG